MRRRGGFTLIEAALTTVIVGTGVLSIVAAQQAFHRKNDWAQRTGTAMLLANELRELTLPLPVFDPITGKDQLGAAPGETIADFNDLMDFAGPIDQNGFATGLTFTPPINALRQTVPNMERWTQRIKVESVLDNNMSSTITQALGTTTLTRVTVTVLYQGPHDAQPNTMTTLTWAVGGQ